jgi:hypothetical protein
VTLPPLTPLDLVNGGMFLVIWLVQLIIYPGFAHYEAHRLVPWHARYTRLIGYFVVPLMIGQLALLAPGAYRGEPAATAMLAMALMCWGATFKFSVPLHRRIAGNDDPVGAVALLVRTNWPRTVLWTAVFIVGLASG